MAMWDVTISLDPPGSAFLSACCFVHTSASKTKSRKLEPLLWFCMCLCKVLAPMAMKISVLKLPKVLLPGHDLHGNGLLTDEITVCWEVTLPC